MATYKVLQNVEAEDKLIGPLTLRQAIYAGIAALCLYFSFLAVTKGAGFLIVLFLPVAGVTGFFAFPWGKDQPTEVWALAKIRFAIKPRKRIWDQSGAKELVSVTVPKAIERRLTNGLDQDQVRSRLSALANTIDSRGWAVKNINVNLAGSGAMAYAGASDRLVPASTLPQEVVSIDVRASDDILDATNSPVAQNFQNMITASAAAHRQQLISQMQQPATATPPASTLQQQPPADYWFMHQTQATPAQGQAVFTDNSVVLPGGQGLTPAAPQAAMPTAEEEAMVAKFKTENSSQSAAYGHMKMLKTPEQIAEDARAQAAIAQAVKPAVTPDTQAAIMNLANNDDLDIATIARQASQQAKHDSEDEVVISLR